MGYSAKKSASQGSVSINITDYEKLLLASGVTYSVDELYLLVGDKNIEEGWVIYVSIFKAFLLPFLNAFIDGFVKQQIPFKIPCNSQVHDSLVSGEFGLDQIGKVICIYPVDEMTAKEVAKQLLKIAESFYGPEVPSAILLKGCIYAQFNSKFRSGNPVNSEMEKTTLWPFQDISTGLPKKPVKWLNKKYFVTLYLKKDFKGFVYKSINFNKWYDIQWCVIK